MNFNELYESAYNQNLHHHPRKFVEFFAHNRILIEGQNLSNNNVIYDSVTRLTSDYAHSLTLNESYTKARPEIEKAIKLFENHPDYKTEKLLENKYYETLIFDRSVVKYYAKNYKEAIVDLNILTNNFPENEKYENWLRAAKAYKLNEIERILYIVSPAMILCDILADDNNLILSSIITVVLVACLIGIGVIEFLKWKRRKIKST